MKTLIVLLVACFAVSAFADGNLGFSIKNREGFWRADIVEKDAMREGSLSIQGSRYALSAYEQDSRLYLPFAQYSNDSMEIKVWDEAHTWYKGIMYGSMLQSVDVYRDMKKGTMRMYGKIGDNLNFEYTTHINKKGKRSAELYWVDSGEDQPAEMSLRIDFTPEKQEGSCKGKLYASNVEVATFACKSDGKLMDAFYNNEVDVLAWLVHIIITPSDSK